jgi:hypothetical protein
MTTNQKSLNYDKNYQIALSSIGHDADCPVVFRYKGANSTQSRPDMGSGSRVY